MREIIETVRQAFDLLNGRLRRRWLLHVPWALLSAALEMLATAGMLILIRLVSDPAGAGRSASLKASVVCERNAETKPYMNRSAVR